MKMLFGFIFVLAMLGCTIYKRKFFIKQYGIKGFIINIVAYVIAGILFLGQFIATL